MKKELRLLTILHILNDGFRTSIIIILPFVAKDLFLSLTQVGILGSSLSTVAAILAIPSGLIASRIGGFKLLFLSLAFFSVGFFTISSAPGFLFLLLAYYLSAIGFAFFHPVSFALVTRLSGKENLGKHMGAFMSVGDIGRMIIPTIALLLIPIFGWRWVTFGTAVIGFLVFIASQFYSKNRVEEKKGQKVFETKRQWLKNSLVLLKERHFIIVALAAIFDTLASSNIFAFLPFLLLARNVQPTQLALFTGVYFLGSLFGKSFLGRAVDRFGNRLVFIVSEYSMTLILIILVASHAFSLLLFISFLLGLFAKGTSPVLQTLVSQAIHEAHIEKAFGISETLITIAGALTLIISGIVADAFGVVSVFYLSAALAVLATIPVFTLKNKKVVVETI